MFRLVLAKHRDELLESQEVETRRCSLGSGWKAMLELCAPLPEKDGSGLDEETEV